MVEAASNDTSKSIKPLFRWVGGKQKLLAKILPHIPKSFGTYFEPFFGGGALYFSLAPKSAVIGDKNPDVVNYLTVVRSNPSGLIRSLANNTNSSCAYYKTRASSPTNPVLRAARFQYLVNLGFGGVYRVNKSGEFNVPYSKETDRVYFDATQILKASEILKNASILCGNFSETVEAARKGDLVYFDPPYTVAHDNNGFLEYNESIFQWDDQCKLALLVRRLVRRGVKVVMSNANHSSLRKLYDSSHIVEIHRKSTIAASAEHRGDVKEILIVYT